MELRDSFSGNCIPLDNISILANSSAIKTINQSSNRRTVEDEESISDEENVSENFDTFDINFAFNPVDISSDSDQQIITYIGGYVVRSLCKKIICETCINSLYSINKSFQHVLIALKDKGGLVYPSDDVIAICLKTESIIKTMLSESGGKMLLPKYDKLTILSKALKAFIGIPIFKSLEDHMYEQFPTSNHLINLLKAVIEKFIDIRIHYISKQYDHIPAKKRQLYNKLLHFKGQ